MAGDEILQSEKEKAAMGAHREPLVVLWLILVGLLVIYGISFLVALKTNVSLLGMLGLPPANPLYESPYLFFLYSAETHPGYFDASMLDVPGLLLKIVWLAAVLAGAILLYRAKTSVQPGGLFIERWRLQASRWVVVCVAALLTAGALSVLLETLGVWKRLALYPDPRQEQGAPYWLWWLAVAAAVVLWYGLLRKSPAHPDTFHRWARRLASMAALSLLVGVIALLLHAIRPEPTQGRYYGIPGFTVGREQNYEYGTYYGMIAGTTAFLLAFVQLAFVLLSARVRPRSWRQL